MGVIPMNNIFMLNRTISIVGKSFGHIDSIITCDTDTRITGGICINPIRHINITKSVEFKNGAIIERYWFKDVYGHYRLYHTQYRTKHNTIINVSNANVLSKMISLTTGTNTNVISTILDYLDTTSSDMLDDVWNNYESLHGVGTCAIETHRIDDIRMHICEFMDGATEHIQTYTADISFTPMKILIGIDHTSIPGIAIPKDYSVQIADYSLPIVDIVKSIPYTDFNIIIVYDKHKESMDITDTIIVDRYTDATIDKLSCQWHINMLGYEICSRIISRIDVPYIKAVITRTFGDELLIELFDIQNNDKLITRYYIDLALTPMISKGIVQIEGI